MKQFLYSIWMMFSLIIFIQYMTGDYELWVGILMILPLSMGLSHTAYMLYRKEPK